MVSAGQQYCSALDRQGPGTRCYGGSTHWFSRGAAQNHGRRTHTYQNLEMTNILDKINIVFICAANFTK